MSYGENGFVIYGGRLRKALVLENSELDNLEIELFSENGKSVRLSASIGEADRSRRPGGSVSAVIISAFDKEYAYALTLKGLEFLLESDCKNITVIDNINTKGDLVINRPVSIYARSYLNVKGSVYYISEETGELVISGNISAENFACSAPNSHITVPDNIAPEKAYLYINAKSINGIETLQNHRYASSIEELRELISLPLYFKPDKETVIITNVCFNEPFIINFPCRIKIETNCKKTEKFSIDTDKKGEIELFGDFDYRKININARRCNIKWENSCRLDQAADKFNVKSFNGYDLKDYVLGGSGKASITGAELKAEGVLLTNNISWKVKENVLSATVNGVVAPSALKNAELVFDCDGGEVSIDPASKGEHGGIDLTGNLGAYVTVTDQKGGERKYRIETKVETKLPVVVIETENKTPIEDKDNYIDAKIAVENDFSTDLPATAKTDVRIKGRGNSTWSWFDKKPYKLKFESDISLLGLCEGKNWVLLANYADQSLIRNYVALESAKILDNMDCYATQYPVDVFLNGEYVGVYSLGEQIEVSESRAELLSDSRSVDTGFFLEIGGTY
ncbi:MAG: CotH kinase family protein, partial [Clostridia bacterium]|nr:CotH kinase family protein [Clostridia bacterium]